MEAFFCILVFGLLLAVAPASCKWLPTEATWYGDVNGDGSTGGACGYKHLVDMSPFRGQSAAVSDVLFLNGLGCGACFKVRCLYRNMCALRPATVIVMDQSPGGQTPHFDMAGLSIGHMAKRGMEASLRNVGFLPSYMVQYERVNCGYRGRGITFHIYDGSSADWLSLLVTYVNRAGVVSSMQFCDKDCKKWRNMYHLWGAIYAISQPGKGPFSIRINSGGKSKTAPNVIPVNWSLGKAYSSRVNF